MLSLKELEEKIKTTFQPIVLEIQDDSAKHAGHQGHIPGQLTHVSMLLVSDAFENVNRVERHRLVFQRLGFDQTAIHAFSMKLYSSKEWAQKTAYQSV